MCCKCLYNKNVSMINTEIPVFIIIFHYSPYVICVYISRIHQQSSHYCTPRLCFFIFCFMSFFYYTPKILFILSVIIIFPVIMAPDRNFCNLILPPLFYWRSLNSKWYYNSILCFLKRKNPKRVVSISPTSWFILRTNPILGY